jgi:hypothetical protein
MKAELVLSKTHQNKQFSINQRLIKKAALLLVNTGVFEDIDNEHYRISAKFMDTFEQRCLEKLLHYTNANRKCKSIISEAISECVSAFINAAGLKLTYEEFMTCVATTWYMLVCEGIINIPIQMSNDE